MVESGHPNFSHRHHLLLPPTQPPLQPAVARTGFVGGGRSDEEGTRRRKKKLALCVHENVTPLPFPIPVLPAAIARCEGLQMTIKYGAKLSLKKYEQRETESPCHSMLSREVGQRKKGKGGAPMPTAGS